MEQMGLLIALIISIVITVIICIKVRMLSQDNKLYKKEKFINEKSIKDAIKNNELYLLYQPQINVANNELFGVEALVRWNHRAEGEVQPNRFIKIAEESDAIKLVGKWVIEESCRQLKEWNDSGYKVNHISINISAKELIDSEIVDFIEEIIKKYSIEPKQLVFEITESSSARLHKEIKVNLDKISKLGISIAIDDFGKEYSVLSYLVDFPVRIIKIDKIFADKIIEDARVMEMIINLAENMKFDVICEGVETKEQLEKIHQIGCRIIQGYYYDKPVAPIYIEQKYFKNI